MITTVIFDMDGVLINSEPLWEKTETILLKRRGITYNADYRDKILGLNQFDSANILINTFNLEDTPSKIIEEREDILLGLYETELSLMDGANELLEEIEKQKLKIGLASSSPMEVIKYVLNKFSLYKYFETVVSGECTEKGKPEPDIYLEAARQLSESPQNCIAIEDSINGVISAKNADMFCIALPDKRLDINRYKSADLILEKLSDIKIENITNIN